MESTEIDFGELSHDLNFKERVLDFRKELAETEKMLQKLFSEYKYDDLSLEDKVRYDLFVAFSINSFYWMYLRTKGIDPNQHDIKSQINRVREYMSKSKKIYEKKTIMPRVDQEAAKRFIKSGLWTPDNPKEEGVPSRKRKREEENE